jgi:tRNA(fMet)-specific endonuclease VapC
VTYLLDTNVCIAIMNQSAGMVRLNLAIAIESEAEIFLPSVVIHELWFGVSNSQRRERNVAVLRKFLGRGFEAQDFSSLDAEVAGQIRASLKALGTPIGAYDTLIAGQALARGLTLVTANTREFSRVAGLKLADWTQ